MQTSFPFENVYIHLKQYKYTLNSTSGKPRKSSLKLHFSFGKGRLTNAHGLLFVVFHRKNKRQTVGILSWSASTHAQGSSDKTIVLNS